VRWNKVTLVGVGLLGGSLGQALKKRRLAGSVVGFVRRKASIAECQKFKAVDEATLDLKEAVSGADLVILCTPIAQMKALGQQMLPHLKAGAVVTDVGSVKGAVVRDLEKLLSRAAAHFIGSHPMAGAEKMGVAWARPNLFEGAACIVTPSAKSNRVALKKVETLWKSVGGRVLRLSSEKHDELVGRTSHLPHVIAATLANVVLGGKPPLQQAALCANGFRDTTRIASGSPEMWRDIAVANRNFLGEALDLFLTEARKLRRYIGQGNAKGIEQYLRHAKARRDSWQRVGSPRGLE
jgi:prephenate dehydrogenase